jgi:hypothetical protein
MYGRAIGQRDPTGAESPLRGGEAGCDTLYSEDFQHGRSIGGLAIVNPFLGNVPRTLKPSPPGWRE